MKNDLPIQPGAWLHVGNAACVVVTTFDTHPPGLACELLTNGLVPLLQTVFLDSGRWRFLDAGVRVEPDQFDHFLAQLRAGQLALDLAG